MSKTQNKKIQVQKNPLTKVNPAVSQNPTGGKRKHGEESEMLVLITPPSAIFFKPDVQRTN